MSNLKHAAWPIIKNLLVEVMSQVEGFDLGRYVLEKDPSGHAREPITLRVKDEMKDEIVDRSGSNVLLRDGTLIGRAFRSTKVKEFLKRYADLLRASDGLHELIATKAKVWMRTGSS